MSYVWTGLAIWVLGSLPVSLLVGAMIRRNPVSIKIEEQPICIRRGVKHRQSISSLTE